MVSSIFSFRSKKKPQPFNKPTSGVFIDASHGRNAAIAFRNSRTEEGRQRAIAYLQQDIATAEHEQQEVKEAARTGKLPDEEDEAEFWSRRPATPDYGLEDDSDEDGYCDSDDDWSSRLNNKPRALDSPVEGGPDGQGQLLKIWVPEGGLSASTESLFEWLKEKKRVEEAAAAASSGSSVDRRDSLDLNVNPKVEDAEEHPIEKTNQPSVEETRSPLIEDTKQSPIETKPPLVSSTEDEDWTFVERHE